MQKFSSASVLRRRAQPRASSSTNNIPSCKEIPQARRAVLEAFAVVAVAEFAGDKVTFGRSELSATLGGSMQGVDGTYVHLTVPTRVANTVPCDRFGKQKPLAVTHDLHGCIYPQRQTNPWLPSQPGEHGYMFVGLKGPFKDHERFLGPTTRALFIPEGKSGWRYYGLYVIQRKPDNDLTVDEWNAFPDSVSLFAPR